MKNEMGMNSQRKREISKSKRETSLLDKLFEEGGGPKCYLQGQVMG